MQYKLSVSDLDITKEDLVEIFSNVYNSFFRFQIPIYFKSLCKSETFEECMVDVLLAGKYIKVIDFEDSFSQLPEEYNELYDSLKKIHCNSLVLEVSGFKKFESDWSDDEFYCPVYLLTLDRIKEAFEQIITGNMTGQYTECVKQAFRSFESGNADELDCENLFQYIIFGDAIYG